MTDIAALVAAELFAPVDARVGRMATAIAQRHEGSAQAVLFYGSCLRETRLDGMMLDFYLIVRDYPSAYRSRWLGWANRLVPPNVFPFEFEGLIAKYAVLDQRDFQRFCRGETLTGLSVLARFAQPSRLVWQCGQAASDRVVRAVAAAPAALLARVAPGQPLDRWRAVFAETYRTELRAERTDRSRAIVDVEPGRYRALAMLIADHEPDIDAARRYWARARRMGKALTVLRLAKASLTFAGGIEYLAWKINRHAGTAITITPWQRRHPLAAALTLLPRLLRSGAVR